MPIYITVLSLSATNFDDDCSKSTKGIGEFFSSNESPQKIASKQQQQQQPTGSSRTNVTNGPKTGALGFDLRVQNSMMLPSEVNTQLFIGAREHASSLGILKMLGMHDYNKNPMLSNKKTLITLFAQE